MNHKELFTALKNGKIEKCYLFEGEEEFTKATALRRLRDQVAGGDFAQMNHVRLYDPAPDELIAAAETLPFMSDRRFIEVRQCSLLTSDKTKEYDPDKAVEKYQDYFLSLPDTACIVFYVRGKAEKRKKMYSLLSKRATVVSFEPLSDQELTQWIAQQLNKTGKRISFPCCQQLWFSAGKDLTLLSNELDKLSAYLGEREEVTAQDIDAVCVKSTEYKVFDLSDMLLSGKGPRALQMLDALLKEGQERLMMLSLLGRQCRQLYYISVMTEAGKKPNEIAAEMGLPGFILQKTMPLARRYTPAQLKKAARLCTETEYLVKSGQMMEAGSLEKVMLEIMSLGKEHT